MVVKRLTALLIALLLYEKLASWAQIRGPTRNGCPEENSYENTDSTLPLHYVRYMFGPRNKTNTTFSFLDYLSIMSAVHRLKPSSITVHGNIEPTGKQSNRSSAQDSQQDILFSNKLGSRKCQSCQSHILAAVIVRSVAEVFLFSSTWACSSIFVR